MRTSRFLVLSAALVVTACQSPSGESPEEAAAQLLARHVRRSRGRDAGCTPPAPSCLFGSQFSDIRDNRALEVVGEQWIRSEGEIASELEAAQLVLAVQQSLHTDVTTAAEALAAVDQQEIRHMQLVEAGAPRAYTVYEYGVGDNSYGAIFFAGTTELAAGIHDGDFLTCNVDSGD